jgi:hypothetical protein
MSNEALAKTQSWELHFYQKARRDTRKNSSLFKLTGLQGGPASPIHTWLPEPQKIGLGKAARGRARTPKASRN